MKVKNVVCFSILFFVVVFCGGKALPQELPEYSSKEARLHIGDKAIVKGIVLQLTYYKPSDPNKKKIIFLDIDGKYPNQQFTGVIFEENFSKFPNPQIYESKTVRIKGTIDDYKGRPQIILTSQDQISIVQPKKKN